MQNSGHMVLKGVSRIHNDKLGQMVLEGVNCVHNDKISSNGLERSHLGTHYKNQVMWSLKESIGYTIQTNQVIWS